MYRFSRIVLLVLLSFPARQALAQQGPQYADAEAKQVIERMVAAHGGLATWRSASTISFRDVMFNPSAQSELGRWWVAHQTIDQPTRRVYQTWPLDRAEIVYDGTDAWSVNWQRGNPPRFQASMFYWFLNLPWLTQEPTVRLGTPGTGTLPGHAKTFTTVEMTFTKKPGVGKTTKDRFVLYIDPNTHLLQGYAYSIGYGAMLDLFGMPPEAEVFGPMLRVIDGYTEVDGLRFPNVLHTMAPDGSQTYGHHIILDYALDVPFDESHMQRPANAVVDTSSETRRGASN